MRKQLLFGSILFITTAFILSGCTSFGDNTHYSKSGLYFDTIVSVDIYGCSKDTADSVLSNCTDICTRYENLFNKNIPSSDIARINSGSGTCVSVDHDTAILLSDSLKYCSLSDGAFDITVNPVSDLWDFHEGSEKIPDDDSLEKACSLVDYSKISVDTDNDTVTLENAGASIDVGAAAKGYIADKIAEYLKTEPITGAIINMGGDMRLIGTKSADELFTIGINDPFSKGVPTLALYLSDISVATSGTYERSFTAGGKRYHHILSTKTGKSVDTDIESVTVITDRALDSDCLCTVCIIYGYDKASALIESIPDTEAVFILSDKAVRYTSGAGRYIRQ